MATSIIVHERIAEWIGHLRPRFGADLAVRWVESRSSADLVAAVATGGERSIVVLNLASRAYWGMEGLDALNQVGRDPLILVLNPDDVPEVPTLARELGATLVLSGVVVPPRVEALLRRWLRLITSPRPVRSVATRNEMHR